MTRAIITLPLVSDPDNRQYVTLFCADVKDITAHEGDALWSNVEVRLPSIKVHVESVDIPKVDIPQSMCYSVDYPHRQLREIFERYWIQEANEPGKYDDLVMVMYHGGGWHTLKEQKKEE